METERPILIIKVWFRRDVGRLVRKEYIRRIEKGFNAERVGNTLTFVVREIKEAPLTKYA